MLKTRGVIHIGNLEEERGARFGHTQYLGYCGGTWETFGQHDAMYSPSALQKLLDEGQPICKDCLESTKLGIDLLNGIPKTNYYKITHARMVRHTQDD